MSGGGDDDTVNDDDSCNDDDDCGDEERMTVLLMITVIK